MQQVIIEDIPDAVAQMVVHEVLSLVGESNWNDPLEVSKTIAKMMSIDLSSTDDQEVNVLNMDRTILVPSNQDSNIPFWICQSIIRVDKKNLYITYKGSVYNKIDIIFKSSYFKEQMEKVANYALCTYEIRWGNSPDEEHKLYRKSKTGLCKENWLDKCAKHLLTPEETEGINIKNLIMISFKRKN